MCLIKSLPVSVLVIMKQFFTVNFARCVPNGLLIFFPSYPVMEKSVETWQSGNIWERIVAYKSIIVEPRGKDAFVQVKGDDYVYVVHIIWLRTITCNHRPIYQPICPFTCSLYLKATKIRDSGSVFHAVIQHKLLELYKAKSNENSVMVKRSMYCL